MTIGLKEYQQTAIGELIKSVGSLLEKQADNKVCVFQSPTGSGKTVMVAKFIEGIINEYPDTDMCFFWVSIGKGDLHKQSKRSLDRIFDGFPNCVLVEEEFFGTRNFIEQNEVVVANWEKLRNKDQETGEWKSKLLREGENTNLIQVLEATKEKRKIILIIDESHYASDTARTNELRQIVNADVTLEMSATPRIQPTAQELAKKTAAFILVEPGDVISEGMIKKELIINEGISELVDDEATSQDVVLEAAFKKRNELKEAFAALNLNINPLCLIQLPNAEAGNIKREAIEAFLASKGITKANGKLDVWLSGEEHETQEEIAKLNGAIDFLIFKQAIDTGWDCPRAHILIKLRDIQSFTFEIQTVGRILRMPEQKHYEDEKLNVGFIFTNLQNIEVAREEYNPNIIKHLRSKRRDLYQPLNLPSYYKSRVDFGDITPSFQKVLETVFCLEFGIEMNPTLVSIAENEAKIQAKGLTTAVGHYQDKLLVDARLGGEKFDDFTGHVEPKEAGTIAIRLSDNDLLDTFNQVIKENLNGFAPKRSIPTVRQSIYQWFRKYLGIQFVDGGIVFIQELFLNPRNIGKLSQLLAKATGEYRPIRKEEIKNKIKESYYEWNVKSEEYYNQHTDEVVINHKICIYEPCYLSIARSTPEREFESYLERKGDIISWWYKNGVQKIDFLGIKYMENSMPQTFYPDYIIMYKSGKVGIYDTKKGSTAKEAALRAEALQAYILENNANGKNLVGGIVIQDNTKKMEG